MKKTLGIGENKCSIHLSEDIKAFNNPTASTLIKWDVLFDLSIFLTSKTFLRRIEIGHFFVY